MAFQSDIVEADNGAYILSFLFYVVDYGMVPIELCYVYYSTFCLKVNIVLWFAVFLSKNGVKRLQCPECVCRKSYKQGQISLQNAYDII